MSITDDVAITDDTAASSASGVGGKTTAPPPIDLLTCQPDELASWLNAHRFHNNAMDVASFLLTCTAALPNAEEISAHLMGGGGEATTDDTSAAAADGNNGEMKHEESKEDTTNTNNDNATKTASNELGESIPSFSSLEVSCINPRGKFLLSLHNNGIMLQNPKKAEEQITITKEAVEHAVWFRKPEDYKSLKQLKEGSKKPIPGHMILMCLEDDGVTFRKKAMTQICFQLPSYAAPSVETDEDINEEEWYNGLNSSLLSEQNNITRVLAKMDAKTAKKGGYMFEAGVGSSGNTSTTTAGMPFVGCNRGFNNGALFPLREGLLFFKPPLFVPRSNLASISCGRGSGQSRFVDMVVQLDDDESTLEFTNIERDELQGLNGYIHNVLIPAMKKDAAEGADNDGEEDEDEDVAMAEVVNSSDEDSDSEESSAKCKRKSSRAASKSAREATRAHFSGLNGDDDDVDDDDSDVDSFNEGEDDSDGSNEGSDSDLSESEVVNEEDDDDESGEEERSDDSDDDDGSFEVERSSKKARVD
eukprot:scaffold14725_cov144-Skeletonema_dohrnii-CCMP3373.AAC.5